jgi:hypothetical protein
VDGAHPVVVAVAVVDGAHPVVAVAVAPCLASSHASSVPRQCPVDIRAPSP